MPIPKCSDSIQFLRYPPSGWVSGPLPFVGQQQCWLRTYMDSGSWSGGKLANAIVLKCIAEALSKVFAGALVHWIVLVSPSGARTVVVVPRVLDAVCT